MCQLEVVRRSNSSTHAIVLSLPDRNFLFFLVCFYKRYYCYADKDESVWFYGYTSLLSTYYYYYYYYYSSQQSLEQELKFKGKEIQKH